MSFAGKTVIVTGAGNGIGRAIAVKFAEAGTHTIIADIDEAAGQATTTDLTQVGLSARFVRCDVGDEADVAALIAAALEFGGSVDVLINNAAILDSADFLDLAPDEFDRVLRVNLRGAFLVGQAAARQMVAQVKAGSKPGAIVNLSSVNAIFALPDHAAYSISKGGISQLTKVMALSLAKYNIRANAIGPGSIRTAMLQQVMSDDGIRRRIMSRTPLGRLGEADEIAAVALFLASDAASYITGQTIYADGGRLPLNYTVPVEGQ
jgi:glucose 1-dehydrogenase